MDIKEKAQETLDRATDYKGSKTRKISKGIIGVVIVLLLGALGMEVTNNDFDLGKMLGGSSMEESKVARDEEGNVLFDQEGNVTTDQNAGKKASDYNCDDFKSQPQSQRFFSKVGGTKNDLYVLDGDKDGEACESLPKTEQ